MAPGYNIRRKGKMAKLNKVFLIGNLTRDPELRQTPGGSSVVSFGMAMNRTWMKDGEKQEEVTFVDVTMWGKRAEVINQYFGKGDAILIEGRLTFNQWESKEGEKRSALRVTAESFEFVGANSGGGEKAEGQGEAPDDRPDINEEEIPF